MPKYLLAGLSVDSEVPLPVHSCNYTLETTKTPDLVYRISEQHQNLFENLGRSIETDGLIRVSRMRQFWSSPVLVEYLGFVFQACD